MITRHGSMLVMAGFVPAIHVFCDVVRPKDVDARHEAGHDAEDGCPGMTV
jgi:hypothetical protein